MNYKKITVIWLVFWAGIIAGACASHPEAFQGRVVWVNDGDTIVVLCDGRRIKVRLFGIDAPEKDQPFGKASLKAMIGMAKNKNVAVQKVDVDHYGRTVAWVTLADGRNLNYEMVRLGLAWHYAHYSRDRELARLEKEARAAGRGLWRDPNPEAPWDHKHRK